MTPFWMERAQGWLGLHEDSAAAQDIARLWSDATGFPQPDIRADKYHWCSVYLGACLGAKQFDLTGINGMVKSWLNFKSGLTVYSKSKGIGSVNDGQFGDIVIYDRGSNPAEGHGNFFMSQTATHINGLGGNQNDAVNVAPFAKSSVVGIIRPVPADAQTEKPAPVKHDGSDFALALDLVFAHEGGWSNHPADPGGATNMGITLATFQDWRRMRGQGTATEAQLRAMSKSEAEDIYRTLYWEAARCDSLDSRAMRLMHFDAAVNQGVYRAITFLQMALGNVEVDGQFGPNTSAAEDKADQAALFTEYAARRMHHYGGLGTFGTFGLGWSRRLMRTALPAYSTLDVSSTPGTTPITDPQEETQTGEPRAPAAWLDDPAIHQAIGKGVSTMLERLVLPFVFSLIEKYLGAGGWKMYAGIALLVVNQIAASFGVVPGLPEGEAGGFFQAIIDMLSSSFTTVAGGGLAAVGATHKVYKAGKVVK